MGGNLGIGTRASETIAMEGATDPSRTHIPDPKAEGPAQSLRMPPPLKDRNHPKTAKGLSSNGKRRHRETLAGPSNDICNERRRSLLTAGRSEGGRLEGPAQGCGSGTAGGQGEAGPRALNKADRGGDHCPETVGKGYRGMG